MAYVSILTVPRPASIPDSAAIPTMKRLTCLIFLVVAGACGAAEEKQTVRRPNPAFAPVVDITGLPRVLLIGDSISIGYTVPVRRLLAGRANVHRIPTNGGPTSKGVAELESWLGTGQWDVIHFNHGIHDLRFMENDRRQIGPAEYKANLRRIVTRLRATGAKLIWATITPIPAGELNPPRRFGSVTEYNAIAARVMRENRIRINDLNTYVTPRFTELQKPRDLHYLPAGYEFLAIKVAAEIDAVLGRKL
jgi:lysophospholipase L1-like esterase